VLFFSEFCNELLIIACLQGLVAGRDIRACNALQFLLLLVVLRVPHEPVYDVHKLGEGYDWLILSLLLQFILNSFYLQIGQLRLPAQIPEEPFLVIQIPSRFNLEVHLRLHELLAHAELLLVRGKELLAGTVGRGLVHEWLLSELEGLLLTKLVLSLHHLKRWLLSEVRIIELRLGTKTGGRH